MINPNQTFPQLSEQWIEVNSLEQRYQLGSPAIAKRRKFLNIIPIKRGKKYFIKAHDVYRLDRLHLFLENNPFTPMSSFQEEASIELSEPMQSNQIEQTELDQSSSIASIEETESIPATASITPKESIKPTPPHPTHPLDRHYLLKEIAQEGAWLSTTELRTYLGINPQGNEFRWRQWLFTAIARQGNERLWEISPATSRLEQRYGIDNDGDRTIG